MATPKLDGSIRPWAEGRAQEFVDVDFKTNSFRLVNDILGNAVRDFADRKAFSLMLPDGVFVEKTYAEIDAYADALAGYFRYEIGLKTGDVIAIQLPNSLHYPVILFGALKAGLAVTNVNPLYTPRETIHQIKDSGAKVLFGFALRAEQVEAAVKELNLQKIIIASPWEFFPPEISAKLKHVMVEEQKLVPPVNFSHIAFADVLERGKEFAGKPIDLSDVEPDSTAFIQYTGGTTGASKGVELTHKNVTSVVHIVWSDSVEFFAEGRQNTVLTAIPLYHIFALIMNMMVFTANGGFNILISSPIPLSNIRPAMEKYQLDWITGVETLYAGLLNEPWFKELSPKIGLAAGGGTALRPETQAAWQNKIGRMQEGYGLTETCCVVCFNKSSDPSRNGLVGAPLPGMDAKIVDKEGNAVTFNEPGVLWLKGPNVVSSYRNRPEETKAAFVDGWFCTGDIVSMDEDGCIRIVDREKDMILVSGFNVFPNEIENVISELDGVRDVAVIGIAHEKRGEAPLAFVVKNDPALTEADILAHCRVNLTAYKIPVAVEFRDELPKSPVGKILRKKLRAK